jgi:hypothetical protein
MEEINIGKITIIVEFNEITENGIKSFSKAQWSSEYVIYCSKFDLN